MDIIFIPSIILVNMSIKVKKISVLNTIKINEYI
jgi:hypothetical protein